MIVCLRDLLSDLGWVIVILGALEVLLSSLGLYGTYKVGIVKLSQIISLIISMTHLLYILELTRTLEAVPVVAFANFSIIDHGMPLLSIYCGIFELCISVSYHGCS